MSGKNVFNPVMKDLFFQFFIIEKTLSRIFDKSYREWGISTKQWLVLAVVTHVEKASVSFIADTLQTSHQNIKVIARNLEKKGWVRLAPSPEDGRKTLVLPTEKIREFSLEQGERDRDRLGCLFGIFSKSELDGLAGQLVKFKNHLDLIQDRFV
jgi:DNA-binding MarR family transcriptional regulator